MTCDKSKARHRHHIIPRYKGGTDESTNIVEISVTQHAMYHYCNYQLWGNVEDYVAWRGLSGQISTADFLYEKSKIFSKKANIALQNKIKSDPEFFAEIKRKRSETWKLNKEKHLVKLLERQKKATIIANLPENRKKQKKKFKEIEHQQGEKNSQYGKMWITNGTKKGTYRINNNENIPEGFRKGRICFDETKLTRIYIITTPANQVIKTKNLMNFCGENNLNYNNMLRASKNNKKSHKGYRIYFEEE
jgi:hypothetical protein